MKHSLKTVAGPEYRYAAPAAPGARSKRIEACIARLNAIAPGLLGDDAEEEAMEFSDDQLALLEQMADALEKTPPTEEQPDDPAAGPAKPTPPKPKAPGPTPPTPPAAAQRGVPPPINLQQRILEARAREAQMKNGKGREGLKQRMLNAIKKPLGH
jgi:hypothetical protein